MSIFARLKPRAPRQGFPLLTCTYQSIRFEAGGPAEPVTGAQAAFLRAYHEVESDPTSPLAFEVWEGSAEGPGGQAAPSAVPPEQTAKLRASKPSPSPITSSDLAPPKALKLPVPPTLEEVRAAGYVYPGVAEKIVAEEQAKATAGIRPYGDKEPPGLPEEPPVREEEQPPVDTEQAPQAASQDAEQPLDDTPDPTDTPEAQAAREAAEAASRAALTAVHGEAQPEPTKGRYRRRMGAPT